MLDLRRPFQKRAAEQTDAAPEAADKLADKPPVVDHKSLQAEVNSIHRDLKSLNAQRVAHALASVRGSGSSTARITAIDQERLALAQRLETLESAIRSLHAEQRETSWRQRLPTMRRAYLVELYKAWQRWSDQLGRLMLGRQPHDVVALRQALAEIDQLEHSTAREIADRILPQTLVPLHTAGDQDSLNRARKEKVKLDELRKRQVTEAAAELVATDITGLKLPRVVDAERQRFHEALEAARARLAVEAKRR